MIKVNQTPISETDVASEMQYHKADDQREAMIKAAESLIVSELIRQRAIELKLIDTEHDSDDDSFTQQLFAAELDFPEADDSACETYYKANTEKFQNSPLFEMRHILLAADSKDTEAWFATKDKAQSVLDQLKDNEGDFARLAQTYSDCTSKETGGSLGQISKGQTVTEFERQVFSCGQGLVATPIESRFGFHIVYVDHVVPGESLPYKFVETRIRDYLNEKVRRKSIAQYIEQLINKADIEGFDFNVSDSPLMN